MYQDNELNERHEHKGIYRNKIHHSYTRPRSAKQAIRGKKNCTRQRTRNNDQSLNLTQAVRLATCRLRECARILQTTFIKVGIDTIQGWEPCNIYFASSALKTLWAFT